VQRYLDELDTLAVTKQYYLGALRAWYRFLKKRGLGEDVGAELEAPKNKRRRLPPVLSRAQADRLVEAPIQLRADRLSALDLRDAAFLELLYGTGLRCSEATSLQVGSFQLRDGYAAARVIGKGDKERTIIVEQGKTLDALLRYLARRDELPHADTNPALFLNWYGGAVTRRGAVFIVRRWARRAGLECWPHLLRHTFATHMVAEAGESLRGVQELLGHDDPATTSHYAQIDEARLRVTARLHPRARREPTLEEVGEKAADLGRSAGRLLMDRLRRRRRPTTT
jgi:site-specific recombinase XerD